MPVMLNDKDLLFLLLKSISQYDEYLFIDHKKV